MNGQVADGVPPPARASSTSGRLRHRREFSHVFARPERVLRGRYFKILMRRSAEDVPRLGMAITRKHTRTAVRRNLLKRLIRESFRRHAPRLPKADFVVLSTGASREAAREALRAELEDLWYRLEEP